MRRISFISSSEEVLLIWEMHNFVQLIIIFNMHLFSTIYNLIVSPYLLREEGYEGDEAHNYTGNKFSNQER